MGGGGGFAASLIHELLSDLPAAAWASGLTVQCLTAVRFVVPSEYRLYSVRLCRWGSSMYSVRLRGWVPQYAVVLA